MALRSQPPPGLLCKPYHTAQGVSPWVCVQKISLSTCALLSICCPLLSLCSNPWGGKCCCPSRAARICSKCWFQPRVLSRLTRLSGLTSARGHTIFSTPRLGLYWLLALPRI